MNAGSRMITSSGSKPTSVVVRRRTRMEKTKIMVLFRSQNFLGKIPITVSLLFGKIYLTMD
jgi:hypothetical protein